MNLTLAIQCCSFGFFDFCGNSRDLKIYYLPLIPVTHATALRLPGKPYVVCIFSDLYIAQFPLPGNRKQCSGIQARLPDPDKPTNQPTTMPALNCNALHLVLGALLCHGWDGMGLGFGYWVWDWNDGAGSIRPRLSWMLCVLFFSSYYFFYAFVK